MIRGEYILIALIIIVLFYLFINHVVSPNYEHMQSNEAIQTLASIYNANKMAVNSGSFKTLTSQQVSAENVTSTGINVGSLTSETASVAGHVNANNVISESLQSEQICFDSAHCLDNTSFATLQLMSNPIWQNMYLPNQCIIYDNLTEVKGTVFNPSLGSTFSSIAKWNGKDIYMINGCGNYCAFNTEITAPPSGSANYDFTVLWVRVLSDRNNSFVVSTPKMTIKFASGGRILNNISPNGAVGDAMWNVFEWVPVPILLDSTRIIKLAQYNCDSGSWISGLAFSTNPWNHKRISALELYWNVNQGINQIIAPVGAVWGGGWNNDEYIQVPAGQTVRFVIPIVVSGRTKMFYMVMNNDVWSEAIQNVSIVSASGGSLTPITMMTTFENPFATHFNSKPFQRYFGGIIDKTLIDASGFITMSITAPSATVINFREMGTHDFNPLTPV